MKNNQQRDEAEGRTEAKAAARPKDDQPKRNKKGALERFARRVEEVAQTEKTQTRSR
jgi:hypothetical protein